MGATTGFKTRTSDVADGTSEATSAMTRDQAKRIARAIFDDVEMSGLFSLDRVTDVIERTARMEQTTFHLSSHEFDKFAAALDNPPEPSKGLIQLFEAPGPFGGNIIATTPELAKKARQLLDFMSTPRQTIIQPDD